MTFPPLRIRPIIIPALAALAVLVSPSLAHAAHPAKAGVGLIGCSHKLERSPKTYPLACGDANVGLVSVKWTAFGGSVARGIGILAINECEPNCAAGKVRKTKVRITARRPRSIHGLRSYSQITLTRLNGKQAGRYAINKYGPYQSQP